MRIAPRSFKALLAHSFINCSATLGQCARIDKHTRCVLGYKAVSIQVVHFHESNAGGVIHATHDHGVVTCCQICDDCGFPSITRCVTTGLNLAKLITGDNPANDWRHPVVIGCNRAPVLSCSSNVGLPSTFGSPYWVSSGPMARTMTLLG